MPSANYKIIHPKTRKAWRQWLQKNHASSPGIWLTYYKKESGKPRVEYSEAVEEALCFGWIDSAPRRLDQHRSMLKFTPRKSKSIWSLHNKKRVKQLIKEGSMTEAGIEKIKQAKKNGSWNALTSSDKHIAHNSLPSELIKAFAKNKKALKNFNAFAQGYRWRFLYWIDSAKRSDTKAARIKQTVLMAAANKKPGLKGFKL